VSEPTRERVRATIGLLGGYWCPSAAVARLLEELGELAELLVSRGSDTEPRSSETATRLASELADLWIITTALSDQFLGAVAEPGSHLPRRPSPDILGSLVVAAGRIARIVNYYGGPKIPRDFDGWISLSDAVAEFQQTLSDAAQAHDVDLAKAVDVKLDAIPALDSGRFASGAHDPSTAASLERFLSLHDAIAGSDGAGLTSDAVPADFHARPGRLWGSPEWSEVDLASNLDPIVADLISFTKAAPWEGLDGYVVWGPPLSSPALFEGWLAQLLAGLVACDPAAGQPASGLSEGPERHFGFNGLRLCASGFCSLYDASDSHRSPAGTLLLLYVERSPEGRRAQ
jgi:hypothetical protein